jgi:hypothetical protein
MIITKKDFCLYVEEQFASNDMSMIDNVLIACDKYSVDPELAESLINRSVKEKMRNEYVTLNYLKPESTVIV